MRLAKSGLLVLVVVAVVACWGEKRVGDVEAVRSLRGQRVGVVVRAERYLYGSGELRKGRYAKDVPEAVLSLAEASREPIETSLQALFSSVSLAKYRQEDDPTR